MPTTRTVARRALGQELGGYFVGDAFGGSTTTAITPIPAFLSTELPDDALAYAWFYVPGGATPNLRRITATGVNGTTFTITLDGYLGSAVANGTIFEISTRLPPARDLAASHGETTDLGLNEALNLAAQHLKVRRRDLKKTLVNGQYDYPLDTWTWLDRSARLIDVEEPNVDATTTRKTRRSWELQESGSGNVLHFDQPYRFASGTHVVTLVADCPADRYIKVAGVWTESTVGAANETDQYALEVVPLVTTALYYCLRALRDMHKGAARARYAALAEAQLAEARKLRAYDFTSDIDRSVGDFSGAAEAAAANGNPTAQALLAQGAARPNSRGA